MSYEYPIDKIKKDDIFCEFDGYALAVRFIAIEDGAWYENECKVRGKLIGSEGTIVTFMVRKGSEHYGPELYFGDKSVPYAKVKYLN